MLPLSSLSKSTPPLCQEWLVGCLLGRGIIVSASFSFIISALFLQLCFLLLRLHLRLLYCHRLHLQLRLLLRLPLQLHIHSAFTSNPSSPMVGCCVAVVIVMVGCCVGSDLTQPNLTRPDPTPSNATQPDPTQPNPIRPHPNQHDPTRPNLT